MQPKKYLFYHVCNVWNTAECEKMSLLNKLLQWIRVCSMVDIHWASRQFHKFRNKNVLSPPFWQPEHIDSDTSMTKDVGHRQRRALFLKWARATQEQTHSHSKGEGVVFELRISVMGLAAFWLSKSLVHSWFHPSAHSWELGNTKNDKNNHG